MVTGFDITFCLYFFLYSLSLFVLPVYINKNNIDLKIKLVVVLAVGIISSLVLYYMDGLNRILYAYLILFCIMFTYSWTQSLKSK